MKSKLFIAVFILAVVSSFAFITTDKSAKNETDKTVEDTQPVQGFVLEDDVNW